MADPEPETADVLDNLSRHPAWPKVTEESLELFDPGVTATTDPVPDDLVVKADSWNGSHPAGQPNFTGPPIGTSLTGDTDRDDWSHGGGSTAT